MKKKIIAYYLPQFHEIAENNLWWGEGFTEWTALSKAKKYFPQQNIRYPTNELGYYNLEDPTIIEKQFELASKYGIAGFCLWTYWFGNGEKILEKPLALILDKKINVKYCVAWANHSWYNKSKGIMLKKQQYLGDKDYTDFFEYLLPHFSTDNYIKIDNKPVVVIFDPESIPDLAEYINLWNTLAIKNGFDGVYFIGDFTAHNSRSARLMNSYMDSRVMYYNRSFMQKIKEKLVRKYRIKQLGPIKYDYKEMVSNLWINKTAKDPKEIPIIFSGWDTTIRHGKQGVFFSNFTQATFEKNVTGALLYNESQEIVFLKSWNEWAEGNVIEPDSVFENTLLETVLKSNQ